MNYEVQITLDDAVAEVLGQLTGLDLSYQPEYDRYRAVTRQLNRALRANALENEWGWYASELEVGVANTGKRELIISSTKRPRIINDDAVLFKWKDRTVKWAHFLPRESLPKYEGLPGLWCSVLRQTLLFSRPFTIEENGLTVYVPVMREPRMFRLPPTGEEVPEDIREQLVDFEYPDVITARAAYYYAQTDPVMQPRVQTLEGDYKDIMYQLIERDTRGTDMPYMNGFRLGLHNGVRNVDTNHWHPHSDY